jgi:hypothetical protein
MKTFALTDLLLARRCNVPVAAKEPDVITHLCDVEVSAP